jgi:hypothetical protein
MFGSETLQVIWRQICSSGAHRRDPVPILSRPASLVAAPEAAIEPALLPPFLLRQRATMALRLADQIPGDPAAAALRTLANELECQAAAGEAISIQP